MIKYPGKFYIKSLLGMAEIAEFLLKSRKQRQETMRIFFEMLSISELPESPEALPQWFLLPHALLGDVRTALEVTEWDKLERSQWIHSATLQSRLIRGNEKNVGLMSLLTGIVRNLLYGKSLVSYHIHPEKSGLKEGDPVHSVFSTGDYSSLIFYPNLAYIKLVISDSGAIAFIPTEKGFECSKKLIERGKGISTIEWLFPEYEAALFPRRYAYQLYLMGFVMYHWRPRVIGNASVEIERGGGMQFSRRAITTDIEMRGEVESNLRYLKLI